MGSGSRDGNIKVTVFKVKLPRSQIRKGVPALYIVKHTHARVPLGHGKYVAVFGRCYSTAVSTVLRKKKGIIYFYFSLSPECSHWLWKTNLHPCILNNIILFFCLFLFYCVNFVSAVKSAFCIPITA